MIGLKYFNEFLERIPRDEVTEIENVVRSSSDNEFRAKRSLAGLLGA